MKDWNALMKERGTRTDTPIKPQVVDVLDQLIGSRGKPQSLRMSGISTSESAE